MPAIAATVRLAVEGRHYRIQERIDVRMSYIPTVATGTPQDSVIVFRHVRALYAAIITRVGPIGICRGTLNPHSTVHEQSAHLSVPSSPTRTRQRRFSSPSSGTLSLKTFTLVEHSTEEGPASHRCASATTGSNQNWHRKSSLLSSSLCRTLPTRLLQLPSTSGTRQSIGGVFRGVHIPKTKLR
jgi:hypothetical protein